MNCYCNLTIYNESAHDVYYKNFPVNSARQLTYNTAKPSLTLILDSRHTFITYLKRSIPMTEFGTYAKFYSAEEAEPLLLLLASNNIPFHISKEVNQLDAIIIGNSMDPMFIVSIPPECFTEVNELVAHSVISPDNSEYQIAPKEILPENNQQEQLALHWIILGYLISLFPVAGIFPGIALITTTRRLRNGEKVKLYHQDSVRHGRIMMAIGILMTIWFILYLLYR